jgi:hypothetical protein
VFAIDLFVAGFSTVWLDQAYWERTLASGPETSVKAYIFGGVAWYSIPFGFVTAVSLGCAALTSPSSFHTFPNPLSAAQNGAGFIEPRYGDRVIRKGWRGSDVVAIVHGSHELDECRVDSCVESVDVRCL